MLALLVIATAIGIWQNSNTPRAGASIPETDTETQLAALAPGEEIVLADGTRLRLVGVVSDSRCPMDAMCPTMGEAIVAFEIETAGGYVGDFQVTFEGGTAKKSVKGYQVEVTDVQPYPMASQPTDPADYRVQASIVNE